MPMVTPTPPPAAGPAPLPENPAPTPNPAPDKGTIGGDVLVAQGSPSPKKGSGKIVGLIVGILILVGVGVASVFLIIGLSSSGKVGEYEKIANNLTKKIEESNDNKIIYFYDDLKKIDDSLGKSPYGFDIKESAYIYYLDGKPTVCMSDGQNLLKTDGDSLKVEESKEDCNFKLTEELSKQYITAKYIKDGYTIDSSKTRKVNSFYELDTDKGKLYAKMSLTGKEIELTDDRSIVENVDTFENEMKAVKFYITEVINKPIGSGNEIVNLEKRTTSDGFDYMMIQSSEMYKESLKLLEDISYYLSGRKCPNTMIAIRALVWDDSGIHNSYLIRSLIYGEDGRVEITTLENNESEEKK